MDNLLLNTTPEEELIQAIVKEGQDVDNEAHCYVFTSSYFSSDGGGGVDIKGVYSSREKAAQAFVKAVKEEFKSQNDSYAEDGEIYFAEEPALDIWDDGAYCQFRCSNYLYDMYEWQLSRVSLQ